MFDGGSDWLEGRDSSTDSVEVKEAAEIVGSMGLTGIFYRSMNGWLFSR